MKVFHDAEIEWERADAAHFVGNVRVKPLTAVSEDPLVKVYRVQFAPQSRTNWHAHDGVQLLFVVEGCCRLQRWGRDVEEIALGDTVYIAPDEKHWHGAGPESSMIHIAVNINADTTWMESVSDEQYS